MDFHFHFLKTELSRLYHSLSRTQLLHALIIKTHLAPDPFYATRLVRFYALTGNLSSARKLFNTTSTRTVYLWNSIIRAHAQCYEYGEVLSLFSKMLKTEIRADNFTYACVIRACSENFDVERLKLVHSHAMVCGLAFDSICCSALVSAYAKLGLLDEACKVFDKMSQPDLVMWNSIISGFGYFGFWDKGLQFFSRMRQLGKKPDGYTMVGLASCLSDSNLVKVGEGIHTFCLKSNLDSNQHVGSVLVSMYSRFNCMDSAYLVFCNMWEPDLISWSALIAGYSQYGDHEKAIFLFKKLMEDKKADSILIATTLAAAAQLSNVRYGVEIHNYVIRHGIEFDVKVSSSLIDMYFKCGYVGSGLAVFGIMQDKNIVCYNTVISGLGLHGFASHAFNVFEELQKQGLVPDRSTFSALLLTCCHSGLVREGREIFREMESNFCIQPEVEHYVYMVKLLGMSARLEEAFNLALSLPQPVDCGIWGALLSCCEARGNCALAEIVSSKLSAISPEKSSYKVMLSNAYAGDGRWSDAKKLRDDIIDRKQRKWPGVSWIAESCLAVQYFAGQNPLLLCPDRQTEVNFRNIDFEAISNMYYSSKILTLTRRSKK